MNQITTIFSSSILAVTSIRKIGLFKYYLISGLISIILFSIIILGSWGIGDDIGQKIISYIPFLGNYESIGTWFGRISFLVIGILLFKYILLIVISPFMGGLSEKIEKYYAQDTTAISLSFFTAFSRGLKISIRNIILELLLTILLLLMSLIPFFAVITAPLIFIVQAYFVGFGNMDFYMERHNSIKESRRYVRKYALFAIGNGSIFLFLLFVPILGALLAPCFTASSATLGIIQFEKKKLQL